MVQHEGGRLRVRWFPLTHIHGLWLNHTRDEGSFQDWASCRNQMKDPTLPNPAQLYCFSKRMQKIHSSEREGNVCKGRRDEH